MGVGRSKINWHRRIRRRNRRRGDERGMEKLKRRKNKKERIMRREKGKGSVEKEGRE